MNQRSLQKNIIRFFCVILFFGCILVFVFRHKETDAKFLQKVGEITFLKYHKNELAAKILNKSSRLNPDDFYTYFLLGRISFVEGKLSESISYYNRAINLNNSHKESYYGRGLSYGFSGPYFSMEAERDFKKYIEIDNYETKESGHHGFGAWAGYNDLAWVYFTRGDFTTAESTSKEGLKISENPWLLNMAGVSLFAQNKCDEGKLYLEAASKKSASTSVIEFGEAYSGDDQRWWINGKKEMDQVIKENLALCNNGSK